MSQQAAIATLTAAIAIIGANALALSPIAGTVASTFVDTQAEQVMLASASYGLATALSALLIAPQADRWGLAPTLKRALLLLGSALLLSALTPVLFGLYLAQALAGLAAGVALPCIYALANELAKEGEKSHTLGRVLTGWTWGMVAGVGLAALLADLWHWRSVYLLMGAISLGLAWQLHRLALPPQRASDQLSQPSSPLRALKVAGVYPALGICASYMVAFYGSYAYLGSYLESHFQLSALGAGLAPILYGLGFGLSAPLDRLIDRHGAKQIAPWVFAVLTLTYLALALSTTWLIGLYSLCFFWGVANHLGLNLIVGTLSALDRQQRAAIMGLYSGTTYLAMCLGTVSFLPLFDYGGLMLCALCSALCILPALYASWLQRPASQSTPSSASP